MQDKAKPSPIVQELCKKLKLQLDQLGVNREEAPPILDIRAKKDLFQTLQKQLADLSR